ncbi:MAG: ABC transporter permease, partial [Candidatus Wenzhouxiangella sp. M2_3B_020]
SARRIAHAPRTSTAIVLCIGLGMAATAAVTTLVGLTTFRPLPFPDAERLVRIWNAEVGRPATEELAPAELSDLRTGMSTLDALEAAARARLIWQLPDRAGRRVEGEAVTRGYFDLLDVQPALGRGFTADEWTAGTPVMLLSHAAWAREFQLDPDIIGQSIRTSTQNQEIRRSYTVVGILPPDFHGTIEDDMPDLEFWVPFNSYYEPETLARRDLRNVLVVGRLAPGASLPAARAEADAIAERLAPEYAEFQLEHEFRVEPMGANWRAGFRRANGLLAGAAGLLLAIAVLNVAMLMLTRTLERRHELALRGALGAGRAGLLGPVVGEALLLAVVGGLVGCLAAAPLLDAFLALAGTQIPDYLDVQPGAGTLAVAFAAMLVSGLLAAALPARAAMRIDVNDALREGSGRLAGSRTASRWGRWIIGGQIALTLTLLVTGALLGRAWLELGQRDLGFETGNRLRMGLFISPEDVPDEDGLPAFVDRLETELMREPGVRDVALLWPTVPMLAPVAGRLQWPELGEDGMAVSNYIVDDGFFDGLGIDRVAGRVFDSRDRGLDARTAVVGRSVAERMGGPDAALQRDIMLNGNPYRIIGVVGDTRFGGPEGEPGFDHQVYLSYDQMPRRIVSPIIEVDGDPAAFAQPLTAALGRIAPDSA